MSIHLGKISAAKFGIGGYNSAEFGLFLSFSFGTSGIDVAYKEWCPGLVDTSQHTKWNEEDRSKSFDSIMRKTAELLLKSKRKSVNELVGVPIEVTLKGNGLESWRVLEEVL